MLVIKDYVDEFVGILARATILFYQLDVKKGETTEVCLHNLLTSLTLKNPIYTKVVEVFKMAYSKQVLKFETQL